MNRMSSLLRKIERRLGTKLLGLPDELNKESWVEVIEDDTLDTFSRFFPYKMTIYINTKKPVNGGWFLIDRDLPEDLTILGVVDINWDKFSNDNVGIQEPNGYGMYDFITNDGFSLDQVGLMQSLADHASCFNYDIYVDFRPPNMIKLNSVLGTNVGRTFEHFPLDILLKHPTNLMTISPTMMNTFEDLATADVAIYLKGELKYFNGINTAFANIDLHLDDLDNWASRREDIVQKLDEAHVSASNDALPLMMTV